MPLFLELFEINESVHIQSLTFKKASSLVVFLLLTITPLVTTLPVFNAEATGGSAPWWDTSWFKRRPITINNTLNPDSLTQYQVKVNVNHASDMKSDFSDLRFVDNDSLTVLPYWIETYTANVSATIWIRIPSLSASSNATIYMYYGNNAATSVSNGTATFEFFDDFAGDTLNPDKWTEDAVNNITQTVNNYFRFEDATKSSGTAYWIFDGTDTGSQHQAKWSPISSFIVDFTSRINDVLDLEEGQGFFGLLAPDNTVIGVAGHLDYSTDRKPLRAVAVENPASSNSSGITKWNLVYSKTATFVDSTRWTIANNGTTLKFYDDDGFYLEAPISSAVSKLGLVAGTWGTDQYLDYIQENNIRIRKYASPEPSSLVGLEEDYRMKAKITWWNPAWLYRKPVNITENSGATLTEYQVKLNIDYIPFKMKSDFSDLRFIDSDQSTALPYWIESETPSVSAVVWVKVPNITAHSNKTIYMYYGNPYANSAADGKSTFEFYEDFETAYDGPSQWIEKQPLPLGTSDLTAAVYNGKIYVFGGYSDGTRDVRNATYEYDPSLNTWTQKADMPTARWGPVSVEFNGKIYVFSGQDGENVNEVYDPVNDTWETKAPIPAAFTQGLMAVKYGDKIHLFWTGTHLEYDPASDTYTSRPGMPTSRWWSACAVANDKIYIIGGYQPQLMDAVNVNEVYDPATMEWTIMAPMPVSKWGGGRESPIIDGKIYVTHGRDAASFFDTNYVYDVQTDSWQQKSPAIHPRAGSSVAVVNNKLYVIGGVVRVPNETDIGLAYNEQYDPATDTWIQLPWNFSDPNKVRIDPSAKYEGAHGLLIDEDLGLTQQFAQRPQNYTMCAVDFYWDVTDYYGVNGLQPKGSLLLSDSGNPGNGALYYYDDAGPKLFWFREGEFTYLQAGSWNAWYPVTLVWSGVDSKVIINGTEYSVSSAQVNSDRIYFGTAQQTKMFIDLVRVRKYVSPPPTVTVGAEEESATVQSCDSAGNVQELFYTNELLYLKGSLLMENTDYNLYIVDHTSQWNDGDPIPDRISGTTSLVSSDDSGNIPPTLAWNSLAIGSYDVVIDALENGLYDSAYDVLGYFEVVALPLHDLAVTGMTFSEFNLGGGYVLMINVTVANQGDFMDDVDLAVFANDTVVAVHNITLASGESAVVNSSWNTSGFSYGNYCISSHVTPVPWETDTADNTLNSTSVFVTISGDINCDHKVDVYDLWELGKAYASDPTKPEWNPNADINNDQIVDNADIAIVNESWRQEW